MFDINFYSRRHHYHRYSSDDFALKSIGIANYNSSSAIALFKTTPENPDLKEFFGDLSTTKDKILGIGKESSLELMDFDVKEKKYKLITGLSEIIKLDPDVYKSDKFKILSVSKIEDFLKNWDDVQLGVISEEKEVNSYRAIAYRIQNSMSGCINFEADLTVLKDSRKVKIKLALTDYKDTDSDRTLSFRGSPLITSIPETADGLLHGFRSTSAEPPGTYIPPLFGGTNNPQNTVSANLRLAYDPSTGRYESGTQQILVRLVTSLDPATVPSLRSADLFALTREDIYDDGTDGAGYMGDFKIGSGVPLSKENGNPHLYGPNFVGRCENQNPRVIQVVNRSGKSFRDGDLVMCALIGGEWLVMEYGGGGGYDPNKKNLYFGPSEYQQYIIPAKDYFTADTPEVKQSRFMPPAVLSSIRNEFYLNLSSVVSNSAYGSDISSINNITKLVQLNLFASSIPQDAEDPVAYIEANFDATDKAALTNNSKVIKPLYSIVDNISNYFITPDWNAITDTIDSNHAIPRNIEAKNSRKLTVKNDDNGSSPDTTLDVLRGIEVPVFWGMLFPDGYRTEQCSKFILANTGINNIPIFANDPNLRELSVIATISIPDLKDPIKHMKLYGNDVKPLKNLLSLVRKTGGYFMNKYSLPGTVNSFYNVISLNDSFQRCDDLNRLSSLDNVGSKVYGLEPLKPNRLQFSPLSLEALYLKSQLNNTNYANLKSSIDFIKNFQFSNSNWSSNYLEDYGFWYLIDFLSKNDTAASNSIDIGNNYSNKILSIDEAFPYQETALRHVGPYGISADMLPPVYDYRRSVVMPVLTCKSSLRTSAEALQFDIKQNCGMAPKITISPGFGPQVTVLPIGLGLTWVDQPTVPGAQQNVPQWGDRNRTDDIDSFGTTALHARVYEAWPMDQTLFLGMYFTPLHFNPAPTQYQEEVAYDENGVPSIKQKLVKTRDGSEVPVESVSSVDFKVPTASGGSIMTQGTEITSGNLAPFAEWKYNKIRRGMLLTGGGFAYERNIIGVDPASIKIQPPSGQVTYGGTNYIVGDKFRFLDGTTIEVAGVGTSGTISSFKPAVPGRNPNITTYIPNVQPSYLGSTGNGAKFDKVKLQVRTCYGFDRQPKEVVPITRLTKKSDPKASAEGNNITTVDLKNDSGKPKAYDIFYFFHNDPSHYSIDYTTPFNGGWAQYVICEVNGA